MTRRRIALLLVPLLACDDHLYGTTEAVCREEAPLTWENFGNDFLDDKCNGCHSHHHTGDDRSDAPEGVDFDTWEGLLLNAERVHTRAVEDRTMPPATIVPTLELAMFDEWMRCEVFPAAGVM